MAKPQTSATAPKFIGIENLEHIAEKYESQLVMGAAYNNPGELERLHVKVVSGVQFKYIKSLLIRKGGTTRRKEVGTPVDSKIGFIKERVLTAKLSWNKFHDNEDKYVEYPVQAEASSDFHYPYSEEAFLAITATYGEDLLANLWIGDIENGVPGMDLFDGYLTYINQDVADGFISTTKGNLTAAGPFTAPADKNDYKAWQSFIDWRLTWDPRLRRQNALVYLSTETMSNIFDAYTNKHNDAGNAALDNGNYKFPAMPKVEFIPVDEWEGEGMFATVEGNLIYAVDSDNADSTITVRHGSDADHKDISWQVQSVQGTMLESPLASVFCKSTGAINVSTVQGDYTDTQVIASTSNAEYGVVTIEGAEADEDGNYFAKEGTTVTLKATATETGKFVKWSDGSTEETRNVIARDDMMIFAAVFASK